MARGAEMIEYWHWHTNHFGTETYWIGILPHDQQPGRVYARAEPGSAQSSARPAPESWGSTSGRCGRVCSTRPGRSGDSPSRRRSASRAVTAATTPCRHGRAVVPPDLRGVLSRHLRRGRPSSDRPRRPTRRRGRHGAASIPPNWRRAVRADRPGPAGGRRRAAGLAARLRERPAATSSLGPRTGYGDAEGRARLDVKPATARRRGRGQLPGVLQPQRKRSPSSPRPTRSGSPRGPPPPTGWTV